jgi:hypothetical protein
MPPRLPDLFIVGAPKCGTTALTRYLEGHPQVFMAGRKDLHHFGSDLQMRHRPCADRAAYLQHFAGAGPAHLRLGDSSVWYLYSQRAAAEIAAFNPQARPIILLREPVSMMYALWGQLRYNSVHDEDIDDFALAMAAEADRATGRRLPPRTPLPEGLLYRRVASFAEQVDRYFRAFGRERVLVLLQDDLKTDAEGTWGRVLDFLGLDRGFTPSLDGTIVNAVRCQVASQVPTTFLRVLGPAHWNVAYVQPSRRPADGRFGAGPAIAFAGRCRARCRTPRRPDARRPPAAAANGPL